MINIYVDSDHRGMYTKRIQCEPGTNLYQVLQQHQITLPGAVCRGAGVCGGCQVYIAEEGMECRACRYMVQQDIHVRLRQAPGQQTILLCGATTNEPTTNERVGQPTFDLLKPGIESHTKLGMAVDIGTTTIASVLMNLETGQIYAQAGCMNQQAVYGADVISRIQYAGEPAKRDIKGTETGLDVMHRILMRDIQSLIRYYDQIGYPESQIQRICYSGNTTMLHFLRKQSVAGMMGYPFTPEFLDGIREEQDGREILILPGKSAFVGADIFVGVSAPGIVSEEMVASMNKDAILFAMANPVPEIMPDLAKKAGARIVGTGRSDFPNQVNNVVAFPGIFKGALEGRATQITEEMKLAAALAIASLVPDEELSDDNIMPEAFDPRVADVVSAAVKANIPD